MSETKTEGHEEVQDFAGHHPHVVPLPFLTGIFIALLVLTGITVGAAEFDLGDLNVPVAVLIATIKATLVAAFFMHLRWGKPFNTLVLLTSIGMLALFLIITTMDSSEYKHQVDPAFSANSMQADRVRINAQRKKDGLKPLYFHEGGEKGKAGEGEGEKKTADAGGFTAEQIAKLRKQATSNFGALTDEAKGKPLASSKVALGHKLFFETRLSKNHKISCNSCHGLDSFGVDGKQFSTGHKDQLGDRNSPSVYNAFLQESQFWDGRRPDVEGQARDPILNPVEMAMKDEASVVAVLKSIPGYVEAFKQVYPKDGVTYDNMANAIGAFERRLITRGRWDEFLEGKDDALNAQELRGLQTFMKVNCIQCHQGPLLGGTMKQILGLKEPWPNQKDTGVHRVSGKAWDKMKFKVSQLRNIAETGPYFHDGATKDLAQAVKLMAKHQLAAELNDKQTGDIVAFLKALTGKPVHAELVKAPELPKSGPTTPKADPN